MNATVKLDLDDLRVAMEDLEEKQLPKMTMKTKVDTAARLRAVLKTGEAIDKAIKDEIKVIRNNEPGTIVGDLFKAVLAIVPTTRLNSSKLKEEKPNTYAKFCDTTDQARITFEPR